ncbi:FAD/NAD(P)-binding domain-containing protein [Fomes fomentarius]|nr:FAD/NAD(P)-binding domain-containing protein [Fomes fomentarius]
MAAAFFLCLSPLLALASQVPLSFHPLQSEQCLLPNRIAIIGAGAAGTSAAFWIGKAAQRHGLALEVDVYERNDYIGGRSTTVQPYGDMTLEPVELGGSVFVSVNKNLWRATEEYGFQRIRFENEEDVMGIWDGSEFVIKASGDKFYSGWLSKLKILLRYGYQAPQRTQAVVDSMVDNILSLYDQSPQVFHNISSLALSLGWTEIAAQTALQYLRSNKVDDRWSFEFVEAITRLNYGQACLSDIDRIHGIEGLVSLAADGASTVVRGNRQIFQRFVNDSGATVFLDTTVQSVSRSSPSGPWLVKTSASDDARSYRAVILAAPFDQTGIRFTSTPQIAAVPAQAYVHLHVTLLTTTRPSANASYFNLPQGSAVPAMVLTTHNRARHGSGPEPEFNSLSYLREVRTADLGEWRNDQGQKEWVVKIFSKRRITDAWLAAMFEGQVRWVLRKEWDAYPVLTPTTEFPPIELGEGLYYVNAFEPLISTMETEIIASRNVVDLLLRQHFNSSICETSMEERSEATGTDFVYGWDC